MSEQFSVGFDPLAFFLAMFAVALAYTEYRRNNRIILRIDYVDSSSTRDVSGDYHKLRIRIRNLGIPLHNVSVALAFRSPSGHGWMTLRLHQFTPIPSDPNSEFAKGMVGEFGFDTHKMSDGEISIITMLKNPIVQQCSVNVFSQGFFARGFAVGVRWDLIRERWNEMASRINPHFNTNVRFAGTKNVFLKMGSVLPVFVSLHRHIVSFVRDVRALPPRPPHQPGGSLFGGPPGNFSGGSIFGNG